MKNNFSSLIANDELCNYFASAIQAGSLSHAYILLGAKGTGKHTLSRLVASALNCENKHNESTPIPCYKCDSCKKILGNISADVTFVSREEDKATLGIDPIRFIKEDVAFFPNDGDYKIYIIEDAHTMTLQAQNAFLLTLEEPPSYAIFILICEHTETILETIKSRAPLLRTEPVGNEEIRKYLLKHSQDAQRLATSAKNELDAIISIANGSIGRAIELTDEKARQPFVKQRETAKRLIDLTFSKNTRGLIELFVTLPQKQDELIPIINCAETALRDLILLKKNEDAVLCFYSDRDAAAEKAYGISLSSLLSLYSKLGNTKETLMRNANIKLTLTALLANIQ